MRRMIPFVLICLVVMGLMACVSDPRTLGEKNIQVTIENNKLSPRKWIVPSEESISMTVDNPDGSAHTLVILRNQFPGSVDLSAENIFWKGFVSGANSVVHFRAPAMAGEYIFTCLIPGHYTIGERGTLIVVIPYPSNP